MFQQAKSTTYVQGVKAEYKMPLHRLGSHAEAQKDYL